jgi:hypothetical protein
MIRKYSVRQQSGRIRPASAEKVQDGSGSPDGEMATGSAPQTVALAALSLLLVPNSDYLNGSEIPLALGTERRISTTNSRRRARNDDRRPIGVQHPVNFGLAGANGQDKAAVEMTFPEADHHRCDVKKREERNSNSATKPSTESDQAHDATYALSGSTSSDDSAQMATNSSRGFGPFGRRYPCRSGTS